MKFRDIDLPSSPPSSAAAASSAAGSGGGSHASPHVLAFRRNCRNSLFDGAGRLTK